MEDELLVCGVEPKPWWQAWLLVLHANDLRFKQWPDQNRKQDELTKDRSIPSWATEECLKRREKGRLARGLTLKAWLWWANKLGERGKEIEIFERRKGCPFMEVGLCPHVENGIRTKSLKKNFFQKKKRKFSCKG
jgi:hypothetical protein